MAPAASLLRITALTFLAAAAPAQRAPWSDLDPMLDRAAHVVVARVVRVVPLDRLGAQIQVQPLETLDGSPLRARLAYLDHPRRPLRAGQTQLLVLGRRGPRDYHYPLLARIGGDDPQLPAKIAWMRRTLAIRRLPRARRPEAYVSFDLEALASASPWVRERGLGELERLREGRGEELRAVLDPGELERKIADLPAGDVRRRAERLLAWRRTP